MMTEKLSPVEAERRRIIAALADQTNLRGQAGRTYDAVSEVLALSQGEWYAARGNLQGYLESGYIPGEPGEPVLDWRVDRNATPPSSDYHWCSACGRWES